MKNILFFLLISCFCLSIISCASKSKNSYRGVAFYREAYGEWGWYENRDQENDGKYRWPYDAEGKLLPNVNVTGSPTSGKEM